LIHSDHFLSAIDSRLMTTSGAHRCQNALLDLYEGLDLTVGQACTTTFPENHASSFVILFRRMPHQGVLLGVQEVPGSNPGGPTKRFKHLGFEMFFQYPVGVQPESKNGRRSRTHVILSRASLRITGMCAVLVAFGVGPTHAADVSVRTATTQATNGSVITVTTVGISANDLAWDPNRGQIYLSIPSSAGAQGNSITVLNPSTGQLGASAFAGSEPDLLSVSVNSEYLYVSFDGSSSVQRMTLPALGLDIQFPLGASSIFGPYSAHDLQASPASDHTVLVVLDVTQVDPPEAGAVIYDDATARAKTLCGFGPAAPGCVGTNGQQIDFGLWSPDATEFYGAGEGFSILYNSPVTTSGFGTLSSYSVGSTSGFGGDRIHYDPVTNYIYGDNGAVLNPASGLKVGTFTLPQSNDPVSAAMMVPDGSLGLAFFLYEGLNNGGAFTIESFDINRFTPVAAVSIPNVVGAATHFIRWGSNGLAFTTTTSLSGQPSSGGAVYLISGPFVGLTQGPSVVSGGVLNAASFAKDANGNGTAVAPGSLVQIYGNFTGASPQSETSPGLPLTLGGVSVTFNSVSAPLSLVSPFGAFPFVNAQVPFEALGRRIRNRKRRRQREWRAIPTSVDSDRPGRTWHFHHSADRPRQRNSGLSRPRGPGRQDRCTDRLPRIAGWTRSTRPIGILLRHRSRSPDAVCFRRHRRLKHSANL